MNNASVLFGIVHFLDQTHILIFALFLIGSAFLGVIGHSFRLRAESGFFTVLFHFMMESVGA